MPRMLEQLVDPETGMLDSPFQNGFGVELKKRVLVMLANDNPSLWRIGQTLGFRHDTMLEHLERDAAFRAKVDAAKRAFAWRVEGVLADRALDPKGTLDRIAYLRAYMPEKYARLELNNATVEVNVNFDGMQRAKSRGVVDADVVRDQPQPPKQIDHQPRVS